LLRLVAAALGCINYVNKIAVEANENGGRLHPDASKTIDNLLFPLLALQPSAEERERISTNQNARATPASYVAHLLAMGSREFSETKRLPISDLLLQDWMETPLGLSPNSASLFVAQTVLRCDANSGVYFPSQTFPGGNARNVDMSRVFCPNKIAKNDDPGVLGTLYGLVGPAFESRSIYTMAYVVWPYTIKCETDTAEMGRKASIAVRTPFSHAQQDKMEMEPEKLWASDIDCQDLLDLINLLNVVSLKKCNLYFVICY
jgi:hypothetical protein